MARGKGGGRAQRGQQKAEEEKLCPLCIEPLDPTEQQFFPCPCGYQLCLFCFDRIKSECSNLCPGCRTEYGSEKDPFQKAEAQRRRAGSAGSAAGEPGASPPQARRAPNTPPRPPQPQPLAPAAPLGGATRPVPALAQPVPPAAAPGARRANRAVPAQPERPTQALGSSESAADGHGAQAAAPPPVPLAGISAGGPAWGGAASAAAAAAAEAAAAAAVAAPAAAAAAATPVLRQVGSGHQQVARASCQTVAAVAAAPETPCHAAANGRQARAALAPAPAPADWAPPPPPRLGRGFPAAPMQSVQSTVQAVGLAAGGGVSEARMAKLRARAARGWPLGWGPPLGWRAVQGAGLDTEALALAHATQAAVSARQLSAREGAARLVDLLRRKEADLQARLAAAARPRVQQPAPDPMRPAPAAPSHWAAPGPPSVGTEQIWSDFGAGAVPEQLQALWGASGLAASFAEPQRQASRLPLYSRVRSAERGGGGVAAASVEFCESENGNVVAHAWPLGPQLRDVTLH